MKTLYLVRHAKSSWDDPSLEDTERPLNERGHRSAILMGQRLAERGDTVDLIVTSPALRALTTANYLAKALGYPTDEIRIETMLYFSGINRMLNIVNDCDSSISNVMLVGHNPDMTSFFNYLCGPQTDNMPTGAIAKVGFESEWRKIIANHGTLLDFDYPKKK